MPEQKKTFDCAIDDRKRKEKFSAHVTVSKKAAVRPSLQKGKIDLVDVFITPVSGTLFFYVKNSWMKEAAALAVDGKLKRGSHCHFVVHDASGKGIYMVRDQYGHEIEKRSASLYDLGSNFASQVLRIMKEFH